MSQRADKTIAEIAGGLIVSCQALPGDPLDSIHHIVALARSAEMGGAAGLRVAGVEVVAAVRRACSLPIIGITKDPDRTRAYITPRVEDARALLRAGADVIAVDATDRDRPDGLGAGGYLALLGKELGVPLMADVSNEAEGLRAFVAGADVVATTLAGYTSYTRTTLGPDIGLIRRLARAGRVVAEGRVSTPEQLAACFEAGAYAVVVGRAITRPQDITARFVARSPRTAGLQGWCSTEASRPAGRTPAASASGGMRYWLGIDGGQSGIRCVVLRSDGAVHGSGAAGPYGPVLTATGREELRSSLAAAIGEAMRDGPVPVSAAFLGLSGVVPGGRLEQAVRQAAAGIVPGQQVFVGSDGYAAWAGALSLRPGVVAVAGTGSMVTGVDGQGRVARAGGWGYLFGDEAGAFGIARDAIRLALRTLDERAEPGDLERTIADHFGLDTLEELPKAFYAGEVDRQRVAALAPKLAAARGDERVVALFHGAADTLGSQLVQVARSLSWEGEPIQWSPVGGVFDSARDLFIDRIASYLAGRSDLRFVAVSPRATPAVGAALIAAREDGMDRSSLAAMASALAARDARRGRSEPAERSA